MSNNDTEIIVAAAALVVSVIAFGATLMQCLQQYYASARGYSQCNDKVMGDWANTKTRHFSWKELRFEVEFDAPVIFLCQPDNTNGPVPDNDIYKLDGTPKSLKQTWTTLNTSQRKDYANRSPKERIHTADNERASWTILLSAVQCMEKESKDWHQKQFEYETSSSGPPTTNHVSSQHRLPNGPPALEDSRTLIVALQKKRKSWDTMPSNIIKPYATTTMCHLVEMLAVLGVYWKVFDRRADRYRAEGNGFMVLGERASDLGLVFTFHVNGLSRFERNRVIPVDEIKELCFGWVPTIYRETKNIRRLEVPIHLFDLSSLQMGSAEEIAGTLLIIGCNKNATNHYQGLEGSKGRTSHLFNCKSSLSRRRRCMQYSLTFSSLLVSFEILGMLSQTFHIPDTFYTFIPNPTPDVWDSRAVSLPLLIRAFKDHFVEDLPRRPRNRSVVAKLDQHLNKIIEHLNDQDANDSSGKDTLLRYRALHEAIDSADEILTGKPKANHVDAGDNSANRPAPPRGNAPGLRPETDHQKKRRIMVQDVLRAHIQEVLRVLNERDTRGGEQSLRVPDSRRPQSRGRRSLSPSPNQDSGPSFLDMDEASPDERQHLMMDVYFKRIRRAAVPRADESAQRRESIIRPAASRRGSEASFLSASAPLNIPFPPLQEVPSAHEDEDADQPLSPTAVSPTDAAENIPDSTTTSPQDSRARSVRFPPPLHTITCLAEEEVHYDDVWCTLVFRMICWLMLHNFSKPDKQISRSELLGSRMPVYIT